MQIGIIHSYYGSHRPSGENFMVDGLIKKLSIKFQVSTWTERANSKLISKSSTIFLFRHLIFDYKRKAFEEWIYQNDVVQIHNNFPLLTRANLKTLSRYGKNHRIERVVHNYRMTCLKGTHFRKGVGCNLCTPNSFAPGIIRGCYSDNAIISAIVAKNSRLLREIISKSELSVFIGISPHISQYILNLVQDDSKIKTIVNQIEDSMPEIDPAAQEVLYLGRLDPEKGVLEFLEKWVALLAEGINLPKLNIVGTGEQKKRVDELVERFPGKIASHGYLTGMSLEGVIRTCKIFVFTSNWIEPFGLSIIEAASRGMFLIGVENPILRTLIDTSKNGLFLSQDYSNLEECIYLGLKSDYITHLNESKKRFKDLYAITNDSLWVQHYRYLKQ